jgi:hypothetical protein
MPTSMRQRRIWGWLFNLAAAISLVLHLLLLAQWSIVQYQSRQFFRSLPPGAIVHVHDSYVSVAGLIIPHLKMLIAATAVLPAWWLWRMRRERRLLRSRGFEVVAAQPPP